MHIIRRKMTRIVRRIQARDVDLAAFGRVFRNFLIQRIGDLKSQNHKMLKHPTV